MREFLFTLLLAGALVFSLSLALPAEDVLDTPYDESEQPPYERTPLFSVELMQESARVPVALRKSSPPFQLGSLTGCDVIPAERWERSRHPISNSLIILDHSFRC